MEVLEAHRHLGESAVSSLKRSDIGSCGLLTSQVAFDLARATLIASLISPTMVGAEFPLFCLVERRRRPLGKTSR
jgi:hypothetical protein